MAFKKIPTCLEIISLIKLFSFYRTEDAKTSDLKFLADQKSDRIGRIGSEDDKYKEKVVLKRKREDEEEERRLKEEANKRNQFKVHDIEFIADENQEEIVAPSSKKARKLKNVDLNINVRKWIQETSIICNRYRVGVRPQTAILASVFNHSNLDLDQINLSKSYVAKVRQETVKEDSNCIRENNKMLLKVNLLTIHFDTKLTSEITDGVNCVKDRLAVSVTSPNFPDNQDILLGKFTFNN